MDSYSVAKWLNSECTDEEFIEVLSYLYKMMDGRHTSEELKRGDIDALYCFRKSLFNKFDAIIEEVIPDDSSMCSGAWWKGDK